MFSFCPIELLIFLVSSRIGSVNLVGSLGSPLVVVGFYEAFQLQYLISCNAVMFSGSGRTDS